MRLRDVLETISRAQVDAQTIADRNGLNVLDVRAALSWCARKGLALPVGGGCWGLATKNLAEAVELAGTQGVDLDVEVEGLRRR